MDEIKRGIIVTVVRFVLKVNEWVKRKRGEKLLRPRLSRP